MEIRVVDKNNSSTVFASSYVQGKTAMIPAVFLDPNYNTRELKINNNIYMYYSQTKIVANHDVQHYRMLNSYL